MDTTTTAHVTPACTFCHQTSIVELTAEEASAIAAGVVIQDAATTRPAPDRELIRTGIHPECWTKNLG